MSTLNDDSREPLVTVSVVTGLATGVLAVGVAFGLPLSDDQQAAILGLVAVAAPVAVGLLARRKVFSPASVARILAARPPRGDA